MPKGMWYVQNKVTTHGAQNKGTSSGFPRSTPKVPGGQVTTSNCAKYAFPSGGGRRPDAK